VVIGGIVSSTALVLLVLPVVLRFVLKKQSDTPPPEPDPETARRGAG